jgi:hypothetical protein
MLRLSSPPSVSVIVPAYNAELTLAHCLQSLTSLTYPTFEIIVVDDGSTDTTSSIALRFSCRLVRFPKNCGVAEARNGGAAVARGEILAFTDADCVVSPDWLALLVEVLVTESVAGVSGGYSRSQRDVLFERLQFYLDDFETAVMPAYIEACTTGNFACWTRDFRAIGGFPAGSIWGSEDEELGFVLTRDGRRIRWAHHIRVGHYFRPTMVRFVQQRFLCASGNVRAFMRHPEMAAASSDFDQSLHAVQLTASGTGIVLGAAALLLHSYLPVAPLFMSAVLLPLVFTASGYERLLLEIARQERSQFAALAGFAMLQLRNFVHLAGVAHGACVGAWHWMKEGAAHLVSAPAAPAEEIILEVRD